MGVLTLALPGDGGKAVGPADGRRVLSGRRVGVDLELRARNAKGRIRPREDAGLVAVLPVALPGHHEVLTQVVDGGAALRAGRIRVDPELRTGLGPEPARRAAEDGQRQ